MVKLIFRLLGEAHRWPVWGTIPPQGWCRDGRQQTDPNRRGKPKKKKTAQRKSIYFRRENIDCCNWMLVFCLVTWQRLLREGKNSPSEDREGLEKWDSQNQSLADVAKFISNVNKKEVTTGSSVNRKKLRECLKEAAESKFISRGGNSAAWEQRRASMRISRKNVYRRAMLRSRRLRNSLTNGLNMGNLSEMLCQSSSFTRLCIRTQKSRIGFRSPLLARLDLVSVPIKLSCSPLPGARYESAHRPRATSRSLNASWSATAARHRGSCRCTEWLSCTTESALNLTAVACRPVRSLNL